MFCLFYLNHILDAPITNSLAFFISLTLQLWTGIDRIISFSFALKMIGMQFFGRPHSGADDTRNLARLACKMIRAGIDLRINSESDQFKISPWLNSIQKKFNLIYGCYYSKIDNVYGTFQVRLILNMISDSNQWMWLFLCLILTFTRCNDNVCQKY